MTGISKRGIKTPMDNNAIKTHKIFVYGSLKNGFGNHRFLNGSEFLGTTCTKNTNYIMFSFGAFPAVVKHDEFGYGSIKGELYLVDSTTLFKLDLLESNGDFYTRELTELDNGETAWMYVISNPSTYMSTEDDQIKIKYNEDKLIFSWIQSGENYYKQVANMNDSFLENEAEVIYMDNSEKFDLEKE